MTYSQIINKLKFEVLDTYPTDGINIVIPAYSNYSFQLTSSSNEIKTLKGLLKNENDMSMIDLKDCESKLKKAYNISENDPLIILKFEKNTSVASEKNVQYEVYNPYTFEKLNLDICNDIDVVIPIELDEEIIDLYNLLKDQGYDLFNINNKFYFDICTPFTAENGADVLVTQKKILQRKAPLTGAFLF